ncbi:MAG: TonB-dependent receptor, partial [Blastocatellia bacterium]|nr:TonB-dependent receptor [Blastocatellia bacterium]
MTKTTLAHFGFKILAVAGIVLCLPLLLMSASVMAQTTNGRFVITVKDPSGAIVPGATVTVTNDGTKQEVTGTTNEGGVYTTPLLPVGLYSLTTEASGFKKSISEKLKLDIAQEYGFTVDLQVGGNDEIVVVQAGGEELVQTTNGEVRNTVSSKQTQELPLQTRNPLNLVQLQAGVNGNLSRTTTVINGQRASTAQVTKDGINIQDNFIRSNGLDFSPNLPTVANVGEVTIITQNAGADVAGSSAVRFVTPSGTNEYHGEAFLFNRNSAAGANDFFNNLSGVEKPQLNRNQFGYRIGGPIFKNKLFFFNSYEGIRQREGAQLTATNLLGDARQGIFTYRDNSGQIRKFNILAARGLQIDPVVAGLIAQAPTDTNLATVGDGLNTSGFLFNRSQPLDRNTYSTRIDWNINSRHSINGIYEYANENIARGDIDTSFNRTLQVLQTGRTHFLKGGWNFAVNNRLANEVGVGYNFTDPQFDNIQNPTGFFAGGATVAGLFTNPAVTFLDQGRTTRYTSIFDRASLSLGKHSLQFGFQYDRIRITPFNDAGILPTFNLGQQNFPANFAFRSTDFPGGIDATQLLTANNFLALYSGSIATANVTFNATNQSSGFVRGATQRRKLEIDQYAFYVTDQFRIHPRVTINAGLRYDYITPLREQNNFALLPERGGAADGRSIVLNPNGRVNFANGFLFDPDRNNFAPNISVAWDVPGLGKRQTVLRGGYSIAYVNDESV